MCQSLHALSKNLFDVFFETLIREGVLKSFEGALLSTHIRSAAGSVIDEVPTLVQYVNESDKSSKKSILVGTCNLCEKVRSYLGAT